MLGKVFVSGLLIILVDLGLYLFFDNQFVYPESFLFSVLFILCYTHCDDLVLEYLHDLMCLILFLIDCDSRHLPNVLVKYLI